MAYANRIFKQTQNPTIILINAMIKGYSLNRPFKESFRLFSSMKNQGIWPDEYTPAPLLKACSSLGVLQLGKCIHKEVLVVGFEGFSSIRIGVIELYSSCGVMEDAEKVFDEMYQRDVIVWNLMIRGFCKRRDVDMGLCLFRQMRKRSVVSWNIMISCLAQSRQDSEALGLFHDMLDWGFKPDEVGVLSCCAHAGLFERGRELLSLMVEHHQIEPKLEHYGCMVDLLGRSGCVREAYDLIRSMPGGTPNAALWGSLLSACRTHGDVELAHLAIKDVLD
ncbi:hypothetical protein POTOM_060292 [Populus tomentosa]|uniref:Pentatricopeptide repeat-containing protein n=1 Tax=Populus tomentosa TaxID=118781 RepID=A0A8X7XTJ5_POPTO|nr:hypothetical protein POTOM_060292 [Populus tomentosa]